MMIPLTITTLIAAAAMVRGEVGQFPDSVAVIDSGSYQHIVMDSEHMWMLKFYSDMCGSCAEFQPLWEHLTGESNLGKSLKIGVVPIDEPEGLSLAKELEILEHGLPVVILASNPFDREDFQILHAGGDSETLPEKSELDRRLNDLLHDNDSLQKDEEGFYLKNSPI
mmetsp:Transcript_34548/g.58521  ORF Transcript_34548/g.58521 Transcript_34548/m.58521 type:complete len:167 (-) Transcript_34548:135-635(-)